MREMSNVASGFSGVEDHFFDHANMSEKMKVPRKIKVSGEHDDGETASKLCPWDEEKFDMKVPDRILVVGQDQYFGTTAPPREVVLENSVIPSNHGMVRVPTPPATITLNEHYFPTVEDEEDLDTNPSYSPVRSEKNFSGRSNPFNKTVVSSDQWSSVPHLNASGDGVSKGLAPHEELSHLRMQMAKLNRRLLAVESDNNQRQQREKTLIGLGLGYIVLKVILWLGK